MTLYFLILCMEYWTQDYSYSWYGFGIRAVQYMVSKFWAGRVNLESHGQYISIALKNSPILCPKKYIPSNINQVIIRNIQLVHPKGNQSWIFIGRTDVEAETLILWPLDIKSWLIWKVPDAGKDWKWEEKGKTEDEMVGWHHWLNGHEFEWTLGVGDEQGGLACCSPWGRKELDMTEWLNWT